MSCARAARLALIALLALACRSATVDRTIAQRLDALLSDLNRRGLFDGAVVVGDADHVIWQKGFGSANAERAVPFTPDTPSDGASLAKTLTATLVLMLEAEGKLDLDAPAQALLPELPYADITLRHLLSHSSGLPVLDYDFFDPYLPSDQLRSTEALLGVLHAQKPALASRPGTAFEYSSFGYDLAALAAARAAKMPFHQLLDERIFRPLGIKSAFVRPGRLLDFPEPRTLGYRRADGKLVRNEVFDFEAFHGGSNVYISASDLHRWNVSFIQNKLLAAGTSAAAHDYAIVNGQQSGLTLGNWYRTPDGSAYWYSGHLQGFHSEVFRDVAHKQSIVYTSNNTIDSWLQKSLVRAMHAIVAGRDPGRVEAPAVDDLQKDERPSLAGKWRMSDGSTRTIDNAAGYLRFMHNGVGYRMVQVKKNMFYVPGLDPVIGFVKGPDGAFARIVVASNVDELWGSRGQ